MHQGMSQKITSLSKSLTAITTDILIWYHLFLPLMLATYNDFITLCFHFVIPFGFIFLLYLFNYSLAFAMVLYTHIRSGIIHKRTQPNAAENVPYLIKNALVQYKLNPLISTAPSLTLDFCLAQREF